MYNVVQVGKKFIIRRADRKIEQAPHKAPPALRVVQTFWTGSGWSADPSHAKLFDTLVDAAVCHPPDE